MDPNTRPELDKARTDNQCLLSPPPDPLDQLLTISGAKTTVADNQTRQISKAPKTEFCSARKVWEIISDCRFVTFEQRGVERYEPISLIRDFLKKMPKNLADPQNFRINS